MGAHVKRSRGELTRRVRIALALGRMTADELADLTGARKPWIYQLLSRLQRSGVVVLSEKLPDWEPSRSGMPPSRFWSEGDDFVSPLVDV